MARGCVDRAAAVPTAATPNARAPQAGGGLAEPAMTDSVHFVLGLAMDDQPFTFKEKAKPTAGAVTALVIVAWLVVLALVLLAPQYSPPF